MTRKIVCVVGVVFLVTALYIYVFDNEDVSLRIDVNDKPIYLKRHYRGVGSNINVISYDSYMSSVPDTVAEYVAWRGRDFLYQIKNDTLFIYGGDWDNSFKSSLLRNVVFVNIDEDYLYYFENYKTLNLNYFPPNK